MTKPAAEEVPDDEDAKRSYSVVLQPDRDGEATTMVDLRELVNSGRLAAIQPGGTINVYAEAKDGYDLDGNHLTTSELYRLQVVTPEQLLSLLEKRELGLRTRLEQTLTEMQGLREQLARFKADRFEINVPEGEDAEAANAARTANRSPSRATIIPASQ